MPTSSSSSKEKNTVRWSIKWKLMLLMIILLASMVAILTHLQISSQKRIMEAELNKRIVLMKENLVERGKSFASSLIEHVENDIASFNFSGAIEVVKDGAANNEEVKYAMLTDLSGAVLVHTLKPDLNNHKPDPAAILDSKHIIINEFKEGNESVIGISHTIQISTTPWGILKIVYTLKHLDREIKNSEWQIRQEIKRMISHSVIAALIFIGICFIIVFLVATSFTKPLIQLTNFAKKISRGNFCISSDILQIHSKDEVGLLAATFIQMSNALRDSYNQLEEYNKTLEQRVEERTKALNESLEKVEDANKKIMESIQYAQMIQMSLLTGADEVKAYLPKSFSIWNPRDIVGGDIIFSDFFEHGIVGGVIDCTGHGVPGAFMTMIASSGLKRIVRDEGCHDPAEILKRLNFTVKTLLKQDTDQALSDDGMDAAICFIDTEKEIVIFAGARLPLYYTSNGEIHVIKGNRESIGYKRSDLNFEFTNHTIKIEEQMSFYMTTDGFTDQLGGDRRRRFGVRRFREMLKEHSEKPFEKQRDIFLQAFYEHKGKNDIQDDVTMIGFRLK